jgi:hypothetical protein
MRKVLLHLVITLNNTTIYTILFPGGQNKFSQAGIMSASFKSSGQQKKAR